MDVLSDHRITADLIVMKCGGGDLVIVTITYRDLRGDSSSTVLLRSRTTCKSADVNICFLQQWKAKMSVLFA